MSIKSLYLHVPFCKSICGYCDFCHMFFNKEKVDKWLVALQEELNDKDINKNLETLYLGGGTPTSLDLNQLKTLLELLKPYTDNVLEYTVEINPETIDVEKVKLLSEYKVNRVSIGLQSSDENLLKLMNRHHDFNQVKKVIDLFREYNISNISVDIMYGLPTQTISQLEKTLEDVLILDIKHISIYCLTIEENTLFYKKGYKKVDEDTDADMYDLIVNKLNNSGFNQYEISNFCIEGYESMHNNAYWHYLDFYGISMSASGKQGLVRYDNTKDFNEYLKGNYVEDITMLSKEESMFEYIMMGLRIKKGINLLDFKKAYDVDLLQHYENTITTLESKGLIQIVDGYLRCSEKGYLINNNVIESFIK